jgi:hypothetical protein
MTGRKYLRMIWASWVLGVFCALLILLTMSVGVGVALSVFLGFSAWSNLTAGRRVAERIDAKRR